MSGCVGYVFYDSCGQNHGPIWKTESFLSKGISLANERSPKHRTGTRCLKKTKFSRTTVVHESKRQRVESVTKRTHEEHVAKKGKNSLLYHNFVLQFIPMHQAMKIPDAKAAVDKEWKILEKIPAGNVRNVKSRKEVKKEASKNNNKVHVGSLMDTCHPKNSELETKFQKFKGRVVLRGDIVKDDSGSYAVSLDQGSSASQMTAAKVMDIIARLPDCGGQAADAVSAETQVIQVIMEYGPKILKVPKSECPDRNTHHSM